jgi:poly(hydroxyalkanoate) depolymerase family esterase
MKNLSILLFVVFVAACANKETPDQNVILGTNQTSSSQSSSIGSSLSSEHNSQSSLITSSLSSQSNNSSVQSSQEDSSTSSIISSSIASSISQSSLSSSSLSSISSSSLSSEISSSSSTQSSIGNPVDGLWSKTYFGTSYNYLFDNGNGSMPGRNYPFTYTVSGNQITIANFTGTTLKNGTYTFSITGNTMSFTGTASYTFNKVQGSSSSSAVSSSISSIASSSSLSSNSSVSSSINSSASSSVTPGTFGKVSSFGANPGGIAMYAHALAGNPTNRALVVALHGCQQTASSFKTDSGWDKLGDKYGFYVVFPEQNKTENKTTKTGNQYGCFNWGGFYGDMSIMQRGQGENQSIMNMINYMKTTYNIDPSRIYVTGLSAGAALTNVMLAAWPDIFKAGATMAGIAYGCANSVDSAYGCMGITSSFQPRTGTGCESGEACMDPARKKTPLQWGDLVRNAFPNYTGTYPRVMIWQGDKDQYVDDDNQNEILEQWTNVHGISQTPTQTGTLKSGVTHEYKEFHKNAINVVSTVTIPGQTHGISVDPGTGIDQGGTSGQWAHDKNIYSSYYAAKFFGLIP